VDIIQSFYDDMASQYEKLFRDWQAITCEQGTLLSKLFENNGFDKSAKVLDCACVIARRAQ